MKNDLILLLVKLISAFNAKKKYDKIDQVCDILSDLINKTQDNDDSNIAARIIGLRGDTTPEQPIGGISVLPIFFDKGD